jgi:hypothetical protein
MRKMTIVFLLMAVMATMATAGIREVRVNSGPTLSIYSTDCQVFEIWRSEDGVNFYLHQTVNRDDLELEGPDEYGYRTYVDSAVEEGTKYFYKVLSNGSESNMDYGWSIFPSPTIPPMAQISGDKIVWTWPEYNGFPTNKWIYYSFRRANGNVPGPWGDNGDEIGNECYTDLGTTDGNYVAVVNFEGKVLQTRQSPNGYADMISPEATSVENQAENFSLCQNYPNPFNPVTTIAYTVSNSGHVRLTVFNLSGQQVASLVDEVQPTGRQSVIWDASNFPAGPYFYQLEMDGTSQIGKMSLLK